MGASSCPLFVDGDFVTLTAVTTLFFHQAIATSPLEIGEPMKVNSIAPVAPSLLQSFWAAVATEVTCHGSAQHSAGKNDCSMMGLQSCRAHRILSPNKNISLCVFICISLNVIHSSRLGISQTIRARRT